MLDARTICSVKKSLLRLVILGLLLAALAAGHPALAGPPPGKQVRALTATPATIYASVHNTGVFKTSDLTAPWTGIALWPADALALATGDQAHWRSVYAGLSNGLYVSHNSGDSWTQTLRGRAVYALLAAQRGQYGVLAGTDRGIYRSRNDGQTWYAVAGLGSSKVTALAQSAQASYVFYAAGDGQTWQSTDNGRHWTAFGRGLPAHVSVNGLAVSQAATDTVFAATSAGVWRVSNGTWTLLRHGAPAKVTAIVTDAAHVYAVSSASPLLYISSDNGETWTSQPLGMLNAGLTTLTQDPQQPGTLLAGAENGSVLRSTDGGITWTPQSGSSILGSSSPVLALATIHRPRLPVDGIPDPHLPQVRYFKNNGGHTLHGPFLAFWQTYPDATAISLIGYPETEEFIDRAHGDVPAQYFEHMELLLVGDKVVPAPLGAERAPAGASGTRTYTVDPVFADFYKAYGSLLGPPVSTPLKQTTGDGTGQTYLVQYFRNARLEYHPEYGVADAVQVSKLGEQALHDMGWL